MTKQEALDTIYNIKYLLLDLMGHSIYDERISKVQKKLNELEKFIKEK